MCCLLHLSTDSPIDLSQFDAPGLTFERITDQAAYPGTSMLAFENQWFVASASGCSCTFRRLNSGIELFLEPNEDWLPAEPEEIAATQSLYRVIEGLWRSSSQVDLVDMWEDTPLDQVKSITVSLAQVDLEQFLLFENRRFAFSPATEAAE